MLNKLTRWIRFNLFYLGKPPWDTGVSPPELINFLESTPPGRALDSGCGTGTNLVTMASYGWRVVGVDLAWLSVLKARKKLRQADLDGQVRHGDVTGSLRLAGAFNLVLDIGCYHSLSFQERETYRKKLKSWLSPGGTYLLYAHRQTSPNDTHGVSERDLDLFSRFLKLQWREDSDERRPDGGGGRSATWVQFKQG
jgi:cyclopropane fatty-acyl-phospholipid synthase-like methyltransferase